MSISHFFANPVRGSFQSYMKNCSSILATDPLCFLSGGSFRACCILWGVPLVEDGVATYRCLFLISQSIQRWDVLSLTFAPYLFFFPQLYSKTLHKLYTVCFWNHSVSPIRLLYIHMYIFSCYACFICK